MKMSYTGIAKVYPTLLLLNMDDDHWAWGSKGLMHIVLWEAFFKEIHHLTCQAF